MTNKANAVLQSRGSARNFLFSKTDTGRIRAVDKTKAEGVNEALQSSFPDILLGMGFIDVAVQRLDSVAQFAALAIRMDQTQPDFE